MYKYNKKSNTIINIYDLFLPRFQV